MRESAITSEMVKHFAGKDPGVIIKHADMSTIGLPDLSITGGQVTLWVEVKYVPFKKFVPFDLAKIVGFQGPQFRLVTRLDFHGAGAFYVIFFHQPTTRHWWTLMTTGVRMSNFCHLRRMVDLNETDAWASDMADFKAFDFIWDKILQRRIEIARL